MKNVSEKDCAIEKKKKAKGKTWFQIVIANISALTALTAGFFFGWTSPSIPILISKDGGYNFTFAQCAYFPVITAMTAMIFCPIPGIIVDKIGRKYSLLMLAVLQISVCLLYAFSKHLYLFYIARVLTGIGDASIFAILPVYVGEMLINPKVRGLWGNMISVLMYVGQFLVNVIGGFLDIKTTSLITVMIPIVFLCLSPILPESPTYYAMKGKTEEAKSVLRKLQRIEDVDEEFQEIEIAVKRQTLEAGSWSDLFTIPSNKRAVMAAIFMRTAQQASGYTAISSFTKSIFEQTPGPISANQSLVIFSSSLVITILIGALVTDKLGRRKSLMSSLTGLTLMLTCEAGYFYLVKYHPEVNLENVRFFPLMFMLVYVFFWSTGLGIVPNLMLGELFASNIKGKGLCIANVTLGLTIAATTKIFQVLDEVYGLWSPFAFFAVCSFVCIFIAYSIIPETKRKTLEQIQALLVLGRKK